jgi:Ca2+-binding EF-hand superfamily protein
MVPEIIRGSKKEISLLSEMEKNDIKEVFELFDVDKEGKIDLQHVSLALKALGLQQSVQNELLDARTKLSFEEFVEMATYCMAKRDPDDELKQAFDLFDMDHSGYVTFEKLRTVTSELNEALTDEELKDMIAEADKDHDGKVTFEDFARMMRKIKT